MASPDNSKWVTRLITFGGDNLEQVTETAARVLEVLRELDAKGPQKKDTVRILMVGTGEDISDALHEIFSAQDTPPTEPPIAE